MKKENKLTYYGIVFLFLYEIILKIFERLTTTIVLYFSLNIYIIHISLITIAIGMLFIFIKNKPIIKIKFWMVIVIIITFLGVSLIAPEKWLGSGKYLPDETALLSYRTIILGSFRWAIVIISCVRYYINE